MDMVMAVVVEVLVATVTAVMVMVAMVTAVMVAVVLIAAVYVAVVVVVAVEEDAAVVLVAIINLYLNRTCLWIKGDNYLLSFFY
ncbi:hypothetical protein AN2V17_44190 [Vallitalea sp. AN17-2]|uniref:Uncharacterized protein n=1 Tax=Vallitalea maricola TaxID=3074433 RepID=A0ACB5UQN4_9FIRM|nr:hypothetical protein AN2V17_44190 [Vallitalea sp. AN17-2]